MQHFLKWRVCLKIQSLNQVFVTSQRSLASHWWYRSHHASHHSVPSFTESQSKRLCLLFWRDIKVQIVQRFCNVDACRCSSAFFNEERTALRQKRQKMRLLQQGKMSDVSNCKDLPEEIPLRLNIGTKVTGELRATLSLVWYDQQRH